MASFSSKYVSSSNGEFNPALKQRGYAVTSEYGGPLDTAEWSLTYPGNDWPNIYPGKLVYVFDEDEYYYADSNLIWHPIGDLVGEDIGNDDVYFDIDFTVTGASKDSKYGHTWVFNHGDSVNITPNVAIQIGGKSVRIEGMSIPEPPRLSDFPINSEIRNDAPFFVTADGFRANNTNKVVRSGVIPCEVTTESGLRITGRLKYAINPAGSEDTYEKFIQDVSSRMLYLHPDTPELQKGFLIASESGGALDVTGYTSMPDGDFTDYSKGLMPWYNGQELTNMYLGKRVYNYDPQSPEKSALYRYSYNAGNYREDGVLKHGIRFDVNFYEFGKGIEHNERIINWEYHNPYLLDKQKNDDGTTRRSGTSPENFIAPNWVKFKKNDNNRGKIKDYRVRLSFDEKPGYAHINLSSWGVYDSSVLLYYKWSAYNTGHGSSIGCRLPGPADSFSERRFVTASLTAQLQTPGSSAWQTQILIQDESRFIWDASMRFAADDPAHKSEWSPSDPSIKLSGTSTFPFNSATNGSWNYWLENMTFLRKYIDLTLSLNSDIPGVSSLSYVKKTVLNIEVEPMFASSMIQMSSSSNFSTAPSQLYFSGTREHSTQKVWFRMVPRLKEDNTVYTAIASDVESDVSVMVETPAGLANVSYSKEGVNLYSVPVDTYNLTGAPANWKIYVTGRFKDDMTGIPGGESVDTQFTVTVSAKPLDLKIRFFSDPELTSEVSGIARRSNENKYSIVYATLWDGQVRLTDNIRMTSFNLAGTAAQVLEYTTVPGDSDSYCSNGILRIQVVPKDTIITSDRSGEITVTLADASGEATGSLPVTVTTVGYTMKFRMFSSPNLTEESAVTDWIGKNEMFNLISNIPQYPDPAVRSGYSKWDDNKAVYIAARVENDDDSSDASDISGPGGSQYWMLTINDKHRSPLTDLSSDATFRTDTDYYHKEETLTATWKPYTPAWQAWISPELHAGADVAQTEFVVKFRDQNDPDSEWKKTDDSKSVKFRDYNGDADDDAEFKASFSWGKSGHSGFNIQTADEDTVKVLSMPDTDSEEEFTLKLGCTVTISHVTDTGGMYRETVYDDTVYGHEPVPKAHPERIFPTQGFYTWIDQGNANILFFPSDGYTDDDGDWAFTGTAGGNFEICMTVKGYNLDIADENAVREWFDDGIWDDWDFDGVTERIGSTDVIVRFSTKSAIGNSKSWTFSLKDSSESGSSSTVYATAVRPQRPSIWTPWIFLDGNQKWKNNDGKMRTQSDSQYYDDGYRFVLCDWHHEMRMDVSIDRTDETGFAKWHVSSSSSMTLDSVYKYLTVEAVRDYAPAGAWTPSLDSAKGTFSQVGSRYVLENQPEFKCTLPDRGLQSGTSNTVYVKSIVIDWRYWLITLMPFDDVTGTAWTENEFSINTDYKWGINNFDDTPKVKEYWNEGQQSKVKDVNLRPTSTASRDGIDKNWWTGDVRLTGSRFSAPNEYREFTLGLVPVLTGLPEQPLLSTIFKKDCQGNEYYRIWLAHPLCFNVVEGRNINWSMSPSVYSAYFLSQSSSDPDYEYPVMRDETTPRSEARLSTLPYGYLSVSTSDSVEPSVTSVTYRIKSCSNPEIEFDTTGSQPHSISDKLRYYHDVSILTGWCDAAYRSSYCADESGHETGFWYHEYPGPLLSPYMRGSVEFTSDWVQVDITINLGTMAVPAWAKASSTPSAPYCTLREVDSTTVDLPVTPYHGLTGRTTRTGHVAPLGSLGDADMTWTDLSGTDSVQYEAVYSEHLQRIHMIGNYTGKVTLNSRGSGYKIVERTAPQVSGKNITLSYLVKPNVCASVNPDIPGFTQLLKTADETWIFEIDLGAGKTVSASLDVPIYMKQFGGVKFEVDSANAEDFNIGSSITLLTKVAVADDLDRARDYVEADFDDDGIHPQIPRYLSDYSNNANISNNANTKVPSGGYMTIEFKVDGGYDEYDGDPESDRNADSHAEARSSWSNTYNSANAYRTWKRRFTISKYKGSDDSINSGSHEIQMLAKIYDAAGNLQSVAPVYQSFSATMSDWNKDGDNDGIPADLELVTAPFGTK